MEPDRAETNLSYSEGIPTATILEEESLPKQPKKKYIGRRQAAENTANYRNVAKGGNTVLGKGYEVFESLVC